ncbi:ATP synthase F1 subunit delta [bacterium]|nr:ATP synthase F1 subunit delta [bacterium]
MEFHREYSLVARSYARALLGVARKEGRLDRLAAEAQALAQGFAAVPDALIFLDNPQVSTEKKLSYLASTVEGRIEPILVRMLHMLVQRDRVRYLGEIFEYFAELADEEQGIGRAIVETARELGDDECRNLSVTFERYTKHRLNIDWRIDPRLIGGVVFRFGDLMIDGSLRSGLDEIRERLMETTVLGKE